LYSQRNRLEEARILLEGALERALANDLHAAAFRAMNNLAVNYESSDQYVEAADMSDRGLELARRVGDRVWEEIFLLGPISALVLLGRWDAALAREFETEGVVEELALLAPLVVTECARGDVTQARSRLDGAADLKVSDDAQARYGYLFAEAHVLRAEGRPQEALSAAESAAGGGLGLTFLTMKLGFVEMLESAFALGDSSRVLEVIDRIEALRPGDRSRLLEAHAHRFRAKLTGDEAGYRAAAALFRDRSLEYWLAVTLLEHGEASGSESLLAEAREIFERLGATPWLERAAGSSSEAVLA
jgi:tetratricopeptide (TPR) repeat protein